MYRKIISKKIYEQKERNQYAVKRMSPQSSLGGLRTGMGTTRERKEKDLANRVSDKTLKKKRAK